MKVKEFFNNLIRNRTFRWYALAVFSFVASLFFAVYNLVIGISFGLVWDFSISFYYLLLCVVKAIILCNEYKWRKLSQEQKAEKRLALFKMENIFLLVIDLALLAPIVLLILQKKQTTDIGTIPAIVTAAYTTYKIIMACMQYSQTKKSDNLALHGFKVLNLKEAIVSIITLQNTMVVAFGEESSMRTLTMWTNIGMYVVLLGISIYQFIKIKKYNRIE